MHVAFHERLDVEGTVGEEDAHGALACGADGEEAVEGGLEEEDGVGETVAGAGDVGYERAETAVLGGRGREVHGCVSLLREQSHGVV